MSITRINTNPDSLMAQFQLRKLEFGLSKTIGRLSSGLRITTGADDPSGVALSNKFKAQLSGIGQAMNNVQDALSLMAHADASLNETQDILGRMRDLAVKAANSAVYTAADDASMDAEFQALMTELTRRTSSVTFNTKTLLDGTYSSVILQAGPDNGAAYQISLTIASLTPTGLNINALVITSATPSLSAIDYIQSALNQVSTIQASIGVQELKLQHVINDLSSQQVNMAAAKSRITDADMAAEVSEFTRLQVLTQAATAMIAQANSQPNTVLKLLGL